MSPRSALPMRLEFILLGLIRRQPAHGYDLLQRWVAEGGIGEVWRVKPGLVYAALERLEQTGYATSSLLPGEASPQRRVYTATQAGQSAFLQWMSQPVSAARDLRQDFLARLFFARDVPPAVLQALLSAQQAACRGWSASLEAQLRESAGFQRLVLSYRARQVQAILDWLETIDPHDTGA